MRRREFMTLIGGAAEMDEVQAAARTLGLEVATPEIRRAEDIAPAFDVLKGRADALYVCLDPVLITHRISHQHLCARRATTDDLQFPGIRARGRPDVLWTEQPRSLQARRRICR
jgi:hypothetical protein